MAVIIRTYEGKDLIIPSTAIEELGVRPGESVVIRPRVILKPSKLSASEHERRLKVLGALYGAWTAEDELAFNQLRRGMWKNWQTRNE